MAETYTTSQVAKRIGIHPNTVRLYEEAGLITPPQRLPNGYRVFTGLHLEQFRVARLAFQVEILQNGLRKRAVEIVKASAQQEFDRALALTADYLEQAALEEQNAEQAIAIVRRQLSGAQGPGPQLRLTRKEMADHLHVTVDTLRNWELNGLLTVKRRENGYRVYTAEDLGRLTVIKSLRCANYSLSAILRMLGILNRDPQADIRSAIDSAGEDDILTACDQLLTSLAHAERNAREMQQLLREMKDKFSGCQNATALKVSEGKIV